MLSYTLLVDVMHILKNLKNYLYDQNYIVNVYDNYLYLYNYVELITLNDTKLKLRFATFEIEVDGKNFLVTKMTSKEMLIQGIVENVRFKRCEI